MLPPAHYTAGLAAGLAVNKATGSPGLGVVAAVSTHLLLDWLFDEYWDWGPGDRWVMAQVLTPIGLTALATTLWLSLRGGSWPVVWTDGIGLGWWPLIWGLSGLASDIIDAPLRWLTAKMGWRRPFRSEAGIELFPCHYYSPWYWGQAWPNMLTFFGTAVAEYAVAIPSFLLILLLV